MSFPATNFINHEGFYRIGKVYSVPNDGGVLNLAENSSTKHKGILLRNNSTSTTFFDITFADNQTVRITLINYNNTTVTGNFGAGYLLPCVVKSVKSIAGAAVTGTVTLLL